VIAEIPLGLFAAKALLLSNATAGSPVAPGSPAQFMQLASFLAQISIQVLVMMSHTLLLPVHPQAKGVALALVAPGMPVAPVQLWHVLRRLFQMDPVAHLH
jgi:hypothetical protein